jgi:exopolysaccharide biosynthesis polyprenyl glycosylphosphotransferase
MSRQLETAGKHSEETVERRGAAVNESTEAESETALRKVSLTDTSLDEPSVPSEPPAAIDRQRVHLLHPGAVKRRLAMADLTALAVGVGGATIIQWVMRPVPARTVDAQVLLAIASMPVWLAIAKATSMYVARANVRAADEFRRILGTAALWIATLVGLAFAVKFDLSRLWIVAVFVGVVVVQTLERRAARMLFARLRRAGKLSRPILIVGTDANAVELAEQVHSRPELGYRAVGFIGEGTEIGQRSGLPVLGGFTRTEDIAAEVGATGVMISLYSVDGPAVNALSRRLTDVGLHVTLCTSLSDIDIHRLRFQEIDRKALIYIEPIIRTGWRRAAKQVFDFGISAVGLILTAPIMLIASIAIKIETPGPVIFRQVRVGRNGQEFEILKLRTMVDGADRLKSDLLDLNESDGPLFKIRDDPRVTRTGRLLRKFSIDELPQFWNVVRGEMSVVGPRPALPSEVVQWEADVHERLRVLPGVTGIWQVSGRAATSFEQYKRLDLYYVDNWSLLHDLRIVLKTVGVVLGQRGAS